MTTEKTPDPRLFINMRQRYRKVTCLVGLTSGEPSGMCCISSRRHGADPVFALQLLGQALYSAGEVLYSYLKLEKLTFSSRFLSGTISSVKNVFSFTTLHAIYAFHFWELHIFLVNREGLQGGNSDLILFGSSHALQGQSLQPQQLMKNSALNLDKLSQ